MSQETKYTQIHRDKHGAGVLCKKCEKIVYLSIFDEYPLGDGWSTSGDGYTHGDCNDTLAIQGRFTLAQHLPELIHARIESLEKEKQRTDVNYERQLHKDLDLEIISAQISILKSLIPSHEGKIAKSCQVKEYK